VFILFPRSGLAQTAEPGAAEVFGPVQLPKVFECAPPADGAGALFDSSQNPLAERPPQRLETDRSAFTPSVFTAGTNTWIVESSYSFIAYDTGPSKNSLPETLVRYGIGDRFELRLVYNLERGGSDGTDVSGAILGVGTQQFGYGFKWNMFDQSGWIPSASMLVEGFTPVQASSYTQISAGLIVGWVLPNNWRWDSYIRYNSNRITDAFSVWTYATVLRVPLGRRWEAVGEYFGKFSQDATPAFARQLAGTGITYLVTPSLQVGMRVGGSLNEQTPPFYASIGLGWRF
jgi:hypothetical protein